MDAGRHTPGRKAAIVTAAGKGMGAACARELAARGYSLALMSRSEEATDLARESGGVGLEGSVTEEPHLRTLVDKTLQATLQAYGRVDGVGLTARDIHQPLTSSTSPTKSGTRDSTSWCSTSLGWHAFLL